MNNEIQQVRALMAQKPRANLGFFPTPFYKLERMSREFAAIVDFAGELAGLQREAPPRPRTVPETQFLRPDEPGESLPIDEVLMNASTVAGRLITVPKTFD